MIVRIQANGGSFLGAGKYYLHDKLAEQQLAAAKSGTRVSMRGQTDERVWFTDTRNCLNIDPERALEEMWRTAEDQQWLKAQAGVKRGGRVCEDPVKTLSLSWHKDDMPTPEHMVESADAFLKHMGWEGHQAVLVGHNDTEHRHIHVVLNRVNPDNGRTLDDYREQKRAQEWARTYELEQGQVRCEAREAKAQEKERGGDGRGDGQVAPTKTAANDHLPHNVVMISRPHEQQFHADEQQRVERDAKAALKAEQRAEREAFFKDGSKLFKALRHAVYDEVRRDYKEEWKQFYKDAKAARSSAEAASESSVTRAAYFAGQGRWEEAGAAFADRDAVRDDVERDLGQRKADLKARQTAELRERQKDACNELRDVRDTQYEQLLQRQRDERAALQAGEALATADVGSEREDQPSPPANQNSKSEVPQLAPQASSAANTVEFKAPQAPAQEYQAIEAKVPEAIAQDSVLTDAPSVTGILREAPETTHQPTDLVAGAIGGIASYLADQLGEIFAPTPPEVREAQAKEQARHHAEREAARPERDERQAAYDRIIDNAVRLTEIERQQKSDEWWKERDRGKGYERDQ